MRPIPFPLTSCSPRTLAAGAVVLAALAGHAPARAALEVGVVPATTKVMLDDPFPSDTAAWLTAAGNEWEGLQLVIRGDGPLTGVDVVASDLQVCPDELTIDADRIRLYRAWYLDVTQPSPLGVTLHEREAGLYPDPLIPLRDPYGDGGPVAAPFDLADGETAVVFVDIHVPAGTTPAMYHGALTVSASGEAAVEVPVSLTVWPFELPARKTMGTSFGFSDNLVRNFHGGTDAEPAEDYDETVATYFRVLHEHRIDTTHISGDVDFEFDVDGVLLPVDWTAYDAEVAPFLDGTLYDDGVGNTRFNVAKFRPGGGTGSMTDDEWGQAAAAFAEHLVERGWWDAAYVYATDEPWLNGGDAEYQQIHEDVQRLLAYSELWDHKTLVTSAYYPVVDGDIGIWCPVTPMFADYFYPPGWYEDAAFYAARPDEELWFYVCNADWPPYAGYDIDTRIGHEPRIVKWGTWFEGATGFLYWRVNYWIDNDPWNEWANWDYFGPAASRNGDGLLLYPGDHDGTAAPNGSPEHVAIDGPVVSYRLKQIRDGFEDWELFVLATDLGGGDYTRAQVARAYDRFGDSPFEDCTPDEGDNTYCPDDQPWALDAELLADVRRNVAAKVMFLLDPDGYPDPEAAGDDDDSAAGDDDDDSAAGDDDDGCACADGGRGTGPRAGLLAALLAVIAVRRSSSRRRPC